MASLGVASVTIPASGPLVITYDDGTGVELTRDQITTIAGEVESSAVLQKLLLALWARRNPELDDPSAINGVAVQVNLSALFNHVQYGIA